MNIVIQKILLKHFSGSDEKVAVAPLTSEFERALHRRVQGCAIRDCGVHLEIGLNDHLEIALDPLGERIEIGRCTNANEFGSRGDHHVGFERNMLLNRS